jgi:hypothetical protein
LLITPEGGIVSRTPAPEAGENLQVRTGTIRLGITGIGRVAVDERVTGDQQDVLRESLALKTPEARRTWVVNGLPVSNPTIQQLAFPGVDEHRDTIGISMVFEAPRVATVSGSRMFLTPNLFEQADAPPPAETLRLAPVYYSYRFRDLDSLVFIFPDGYRLEAMPGPTDIPASFGRYRCAFRISGDTALVYTRARELTNRVIPASEFEAFRQFAAKMFKADRLQVVLVKK